MFDLKAIQDALNADPNEVEKFQADPVGYLEAKGLMLPEEAKKQLIEHVKAHGVKAEWSLEVMVAPKQ